MDKEAGIYFYRARYYNPEIGRFLTEDPIGFDGGINFYGYVGGNSINFVDPNGEFAITVPTAVIGGIVIGGGYLICRALGGCAPPPPMASLPPNIPTTQPPSIPPSVPNLKPGPGDKFMFCVKACQAGANQMLKCPTYISAIPCAVTCSYLLLGGGQPPPTN